MSGEQIIGILAGFGFRIHAQRGSHVKLRRVTPDGRVQTLTIPRHREMDIGTV
ncbi:MAG: type II toxin-antitoxin system HicA family toxin [Chloroflexi bacterium]|nr:type II toxin-antitoxin system HicA family toxin [Chloroflexota bacterium]MCI0896272.1 type II toxin-antitoxin system HicA family toxin [Chloroflexota bacterium]